MRDEHGRLTRATIDHLAVAASGAWVVQANTHKGSLQVARSGSLIGRRGEGLLIDGQDQSQMLSAIAKQRGVVRQELDSAGLSIPVHGALCFIGTELPWLAKRVGDTSIVGRRGLARLLKRPGPLAARERQSIALLLDQRFPRR
jgi:hypothetical protein